MHEEEKHAPTAVSVEHTLAKGNNNSCDGEQSSAITAKPKTAALGCLRRFRAGVSTYK